MRSEDTESTRREFLGLMGSMAIPDTAAGEDGGEGSSLQVNVSELDLKFPGRIDKSNLRIPLNALSHALGPSVEDYLYGRDHLKHKIQTLYEDLLSEDRTNGFQRAGLSEGTVSTPDDSLVASLTGDGRISYLSVPGAPSTQVPFFAGGDGLKEMEGSFPGIRKDEETDWLHSHVEGFRYREGTSILDITYDIEDLDILESVYVSPGDDTLVREYKVQNRSGEAVSLDFLYHSRLNVNKDIQNFMIWNSSRNKVESIEDGFRQGLVDSDLAIEVLMEGSEPEFSSGEKPLDGDEGRYIDSRLESRIDLGPGESGSISVRIGPDPEDGGLSEAERYFEEFLEDAELPSGMTIEEEKLYRRVLTTLSGMHDPETGTVSAAPNLQPMYYPSWIRDGAIGTVAMAKAGQEEAAKQFLSGFVPEIQEEDGSFRQCYSDDGEFAGIIELENDQQPIYAWAVSEVYSETGDEEFLEECWPSLEKALDHTVESIQDNGLPAATPDYAEMPSDIRQSMFTAAFAYRGLRDGAQIAEKLGEDGSRYRKASELVGKAAVEEFVEKPEKVASELTLTGPSADQKAVDSMAVYPAEWPADFGVEEEVVSSLDEVDSETVWIPGKLMKASMLYSRDEYQEADQILEEAMQYRNSAGDLAERIGPGDKSSYASPLGWSQAAFILAMEEKYSS